MQKNNYLTIDRKDYLYIPGLAFLLLYVVPLSIVVSNIAEFQHLDRMFTILSLLTISSLVATLGAVLSVGVLVWKPSRPIKFLFRFVFFVCLTAGLVVPLANSAGQVEPALIPIDRLNLFISLSTAIILTLVSITHLHGLVFAITMTVLLGNAVNNTVVTLFSISPKTTSTISKTTSILYEASSKRNIFVLSFDGLPRDATLEVIAENTDLASALKDFTVFDQVISSAPATATSIMSELTGVPNFKREFETEGQLYAGITKADVISNALDENGYRVSSYGTYASSFANQNRAFPYGTLPTEVTLTTRIDQIAGILDYALARAASRHAVVARNLAQKATAKVLGSDELLSRAGQHLQSLTAQHKGRSWDVASILTVLDFEKYSGQLAVVTDEPVAHFLHFTHTHFPVDFDAACQYRSDDYDWYLRNQNRTGVKNEVHCALSQFVYFLTRLRAMGIYDNSLVVLKSDHGKPVAYNDVNRYEGFQVRGHEYWGFGRYTPFLAIKPEGRRRDALAIDKRHVALSDLANSLCRATIISSVDCDQYEGFDLLVPSARIPEDATYFVYLVRDPSSNFKMDTHEAVEIPRNVDFLSTLNDRLTSELLSESPRCDERVSTENGEPYNNGMTDARTWVSWRDGEAWHLKVLVPSCSPKGLEIILIDHTDTTSDSTDLNVRLDGSQITDFKVVDDTSSGLNVTLVLPENQVVGEPTTISVIHGGSAKNVKLVSFSFISYSQ